MAKKEITQYVPVQRDPGQSAAVMSMVEKAHEMAAAYDIATKLAPTAFVPLTLRNKVAETAAAIITGNELGLPLMASLRSIDIIDGTPSLRAVTLRALVLKNGHEIWVEESTQARAIVKGKRKGSDHVATSVWDIDRAKRAGLLNKKNYQANPGMMFIARGTAEVARQIAPDVLLGMPYVAEELEDEGPPMEAVPVVEVPKTRISRKRVVKPEPEPEPEPELTAEDIARAEEMMETAKVANGKPAEPEPADEPEPDDPPAVWDSELNWETAEIPNDD